MDSVSFKLPIIGLQLCVQLLHIFTHHCLSVPRCCTGQSLDGSSIRLLWPLLRPASHPSFLDGETIHSSKNVLSRKIDLVYDPKESCWSSFFQPEAKRKGAGNLPKFVLYFQICNCQACKFSIFKF